MTQEHERPPSKESGRVLGRAFHWINESKLQELREGFEGKEPGLWPTKEDIRVSWGSFDIKTIGPFFYCFLNSHYPEEWQKEPDLFALLLSFKIGPGLGLVSFDVTTDHEALIAGHEGTSGHDRRVTVPLNEYQGNLNKPELLIPAHIPLKKLTFEPLPSYVVEPGIVRF